mmetsp:Transcript_92473/g.298903  ORF Transcript_92473/g.298903 Transcript_92473/m.298903 type:complete len:99 (+) Transcript_92473:74-370(+)
MVEAWRHDSLIERTGRPGVRSMPTLGDDPLEGVSFEARAFDCDVDEDIDFLLGADAWQDRRMKSPRGSSFPARSTSRWVVHGTKLVPSARSKHKPQVG